MMEQVPADVLDPLFMAEKLMGEGKEVAIATVMETWGSAPRPVGSHLIIDQDGNFHGSVSGGCVEGAVVSEAMDVIADGKARMLEFGVADETAWRVGLSCGGRIKVYVERVGRWSRSTSGNSTPNAAPAVQWRWSPTFRANETVLCARPTRSAASWARHCARLSCPASQRQSMPMALLSSSMSTCRRRALSSLALSIFRRRWRRWRRLPGMTSR